MLITKKFTVEMAHIVRKAWSKRCSNSIHGHSYTIEVSLKQENRLENIQGFDESQMVVDFGLIKKYLGPFIDSFDHATMLWAEDDEEVLKFFVLNFDRVIMSKINPTAEMMAALLLVGCNRILQRLQTQGIIDKNVCVQNVTVHETATGRATASVSDKFYRYIVNEKIFEDLWFSVDIMLDWPKGYKELLYPSTNNAEKDVLDEVAEHASKAMKMIAHSLLKNL